MIKATTAVIKQPLKTSFCKTIYLIKMAEKETSLLKIERLTSNQANIRNVATSAHIHHGKCISGDSRIMLTNGSIKLAKDIFDEVSKNGEIYEENEDHTICIPKEKIGVYEAFMCLAMPASIMLFEALELGVDSYLITPDYKKASEVLKLKKDYMCPLLVGFGYEQKGASQKKKERRELKELVFYEKL